MMEKGIPSLHPIDLSSRLSPQNTAPAAKQTRTVNEEVELYHGAASSSRIDKDKADKIVKSMNEVLSASPSPTHIKFEYHEKLNEYYVTVVDERTREIVREIPTKRMLDLNASMKELLGIIVDKKS
ncbi:flagellar protein FlaG [Jeotgalibacillus proteolyticus]|uniref:Flagellar biosynthesis protein FlaG n=1 Tax=Jeotgalibacillus proteolyticus TaxID=2082395 RepID=A0A2S5GB70_9BACL|nr:flagellar protein FlaG [Jeotgalibacillus proteolyticus]PPA70240.1 flagellar biosynthesis protein FlaG [Jeotgalibacillus proteolyticus]